MTTAEILTTIAISIPLLGTFIYYYTKLNVKIAEINKDQLSMRKDFDEHKAENNHDFDAFKTEMIENRKENREEHREIMACMSKVSEELSNLKTVIIKNNK